MHALISSLMSIFLHCGIHPFLLMLPLLSLAKMRLSPTLTLSSLMIWYSGLTVLLLFLLAKAASAFLPTALYGTETTLFFSAGPVCSSFSAEACAILHALCWSQKHQQACHFSSLLLLSDSRSVISSVFLFT